MEAQYTSVDETSMTVTRDGICHAGVVEPNPLWDEVKKRGIAISPYVAPSVSLAARAKAELDRTEHWGGRALEELQLAGALTARGRANLAYRAALREIVAGARTVWPGDPAEV